MTPLSMKDVFTNFLLSWVLYLRRYADLHSVMTDAISQYVEDVKNCDFPNEKEQY